MDDLEFGKKLRELRINAGKTVPEVSEYLKSIGCKAATQTIYGWERGHSQPTTDTFMAMCVFYGLKEILPIFGYKNSSDNDDTRRIQKDEQSHIEKYRLLDPHGKEAVDSILDIEYRRCIAQAQTGPAQAEPEPSVVFVLPAFLSHMSAGTGQPAGDEYPEDYRLTKEPPRGSSYIATVSGDSMEPTFRNGDRVFIHATTEILPGQIGVFYMDGQQWIKELGDGVLISHNARYEPIPMTDSARCQGLVLGVCDDSYFA